MDRPGTIHRNVCDESALHEIDDVARHATTNDMRTHHKNRGRPRRSRGSTGLSERRWDPGHHRVALQSALACLLHPPRDRLERRVLKRRRRRVQR